LSNGTPRWEQKVDHRLRALWVRTPQADRQRESVRVLLRLTESTELLDEYGVQVHSVTGDITSGILVLADLPRIAGQAGIRFIELAQDFAHDE
jgi:hypothetical protein